MKATLLSPLFAAALIFPLSLWADDIAPRPDNGISAHDLRTGALRWANDTIEVGNTRLILRQRSLEISDASRDPAPTIFLDPHHGERLPGSDHSAPLVTSPPSPSASRTLHLARGWHLPHFRPGTDQDLHFQDATGQGVWTIPLARHHYAVATLGDRVFIAQDYLATDAVIQAWQAGDTQARWRIDLNATPGLANGELRRITLWPATPDQLLAQAEHHLFAIDPADGRIIWHLDLAAAAGLPQAELYEDWGSPLASIAIAEGMAVLCFDREVLAVDLEKGRLLWAMEPDTDPHAPLPLIHDGVLVLSTGPGRRVR